MVIYIKEQFIHETKYENYQMDMLHGILNAFAGKDVNIPRYSDIVSNRNDIQNELNGSEILKELIDAW